MQPYAFVILRKRVILRDTTLANDAGNWLRLRHALLLYEELQRPIAPAARRHLEHTGLVTLRVDDGPNIQALQQGAQAMLSASCSIETRPSRGARWTGTVPAC